MGQILSRRRVMGGSPKINWADEYLTFEALESGTFQFTNAVEYSLNNGAWTSLAASTATPTLAAGDLIRWRATITPTSSAGVGTFSATCYYNAMGNPLSLNLGDSFVGVTTMPNYNHIFRLLFKDDIHIVDSKNIVLLSNGLKAYSFYQMFSGCTSLTTTPSITMVGTAAYCCYEMFKGCTSLISSSKIIIYSGGDYTASSMFQGCTDLITADITIEGVTAANWECYKMFDGCSSLVNVFKSLPAKTVGFRAYMYMFQNCTSLVTAPEILVETFTGERSCQGMFNGCTSLQNVQRRLQCTYQYCYMGMFHGCSSLKKAPELPATTLPYQCYGSMFQDCTSLENAPILPAAVIPGSGYEIMFWGCTSLKYLKCLATDRSAARSTSTWVYNVKGNGTFVKHPDAVWDGYWTSSVPLNFIVLEAVQITVTYTGGNSGAYLKEIGGSEIIHTFIDGEPYEADLDDNKSYGVYDSGDNLIQTLATPFSRTVSITI